MIPEICWRGIFKDYRKAMAVGITELPDDFHFAGLLTMLGAAIGRTAYVFSAQNIYTNQFTVLVGPSGQRKTTAISMATELADVKMVYNLNSAEGLVKVLSADASVLVVQDEFTHVFAKARQDGGSTLIPLLNRLYDVPLVAEITTKQDPLHVDLPYTSIFTGTPGDWLKEQLEQHHFTSGFLNRFTYYVGVDKEPIPLPEPAVLGDIRRRVKVFEGRVKPKRYQLDAAAKEVYSVWYRDWKTNPPDNSHSANLVVRLPIKVLKLALTYAVTERTGMITHPQIEAAMAYGAYQLDAMKEVFGEIPLGVNREEERVMHLIEGEMTISKLHQRIGGRVSASQLAQMLDKLVTLERIERFHKEGDNKTWVRMTK